MSSIRSDGTVCLQTVVPKEFDRYITQMTGELMARGIKVSGSDIIRALMGCPNPGDHDWKDFQPSTAMQKRIAAICEGLYREAQAEASIPV